MSAGPTAVPNTARRLAAEAWAVTADLIDRQLSPLGLAAMAAARLRTGDVVIDVGCGAGQTLLQLAERVGPSGRVVGIDIAPQLLDIARRRAAGAPQVSLIEADAQAAPLPMASADLVFSRFGVMAFRDPPAAFAHLRGLLRPGGALAFCCWRGLHENELDNLPLEAAGLAHLANSEPFSLADPSPLRRLLKEAGFDRIEIRAHNEAVSSGDREAMLEVLTRVGPLGRILREDPQLRAEAEPKVRVVLADRERDGVVALQAAVWIVSATSP